jgi:hypothetical protein
VIDIFNIKYCDECGNCFQYPKDGDVYSGFGVCNKCKEELDKI